MYTIHFGQGKEHTQHFRSQAKGNLPYNYDGWDYGSNVVDEAYCENSQIISHQEIYERYGIKHGYKEYCLEVWDPADLPSSPARNACHLPVGGWGDLPNGGYAGDVNAFYLKFDFMYVQTSGGEIITLQRYQNPGAYDAVSKDLILSLSNGYLNVVGCKHIEQPETGYLPNAWIAGHVTGRGKIYLEPNKWHEIQIFVNAYMGFNASEIGPYNLGYTYVEPLNTFFEAYEQDPGYSRILGAESTTRDLALQLDAWPTNGHPKLPNAMLPGQDQTSWPPENYGSGQYFYPQNVGLVYVWVNGNLDIQHTTNLSNETNSFSTRQFLYLGYSIDNDGRFFYDNIIMNDIRDPSGIYPSKIFDPLFSSDTSLGWDPKYKLKFTAMELDNNFWSSPTKNTPNGRKHDTWMPASPRGALVPSGDSYWVNAPIRYGAPTDSMIPHGTQLTVVHVDWDGEEQDYTVHDGNSNLYPDYDTEYAYQHVQPEDSNPFAVNQDDPRLESTVLENKVLFYLKRPIAVSGKQYMAGGFGLGGVKNYSPNIDTSLGTTSLPPIYRIWTCIQDHVITSPYSTQKHMIRVPSGISGYADFISDNVCPGCSENVTYAGGSYSLSNGYSMADWPYNPVTNLPWTWDDIDSLQIGAYHSSKPGTGKVILYTTYLVIEHASPIDNYRTLLDTNLLEWADADEIPFYCQRVDAHKIGWPSKSPNDNTTYYNRWDVSPQPSVSRTDTQSDDDLATVSGISFSGTISWDYYIRYMDGEIATGPQFAPFIEHFDEVWVYTCSGMTPDIPRQTMRGDVITDADGNYYTFLTHPVLQWSNQKYSTDPGATPIVYDTTTFYVVPLTLYGNVPSLSNISNLTTNIPPSTSGTWNIRSQISQFNFKADPYSYFNLFNPSSVLNHVVAYPQSDFNSDFPAALSGHQYYFRAPNLPSGSISQIIYLTDILGISEQAIDAGLYSADIGLYQTTINKTINDTGEGVFEFWDDSAYISGHTFGADSTVGWHLNSATIQIPSGTRQIKFIFTALKKSESALVPGGLFGGTTNMATFDGAFLKINVSGLASYHPSDSNNDNNITNNELLTYIALWQSGILPSGQNKNYLATAEQIWQNGGIYTDCLDNEKPDNWSNDCV